MLLAAKCFLVLLILPTTGVVRGRLLESSNDDDDDEPDFFTATDQMIVAPFQLDDNPTYFGSGCLGGSAEILIPDFVGDEDRTTVTVLFSQFMATTFGPILTAHMSCNMALPVHVEPGRSVGLFQVDYRGYAYVPGGGGSSARFDTEYSFAGQPGPKNSRTYGGSGSGADDDENFDGVFFETDTVEAIIWSECGETTDFRIGTSLLASKPTAWDEDVFIALDSKDIEQDGFYFSFVSRSC